MKPEIFLDIINDIDADLIEGAAVKQGKNRKKAAGFIITAAGVFLITVAGFFAGRNDVT